MSKRSPFGEGGLMDVSTVPGLVKGLIWLSLVYFFLNNFEGIFCFGSNFLFGEPWVLSPANVGRVKAATLLVVIAFFSSCGALIYLLIKKYLAEKGGAFSYRTPAPAAKEGNVRLGPDSSKKGTDLFSRLG